MDRTNPDQAKNRAQARLLESLERLTGDETLPFDQDQQNERYRKRMDVWIRGGVPPGAINFCETKALTNADLPLQYFVSMMNDGLQRLWGHWEDHAPDMEAHGSARWRPDSRYEHLFNPEPSKES